MIEIIIPPVDMPPLNERRYQKECKNDRWSVIDTQDGSVVFKGSFQNVAIAWHNLNKKFYQNNPPHVTE